VLPDAIDNAKVVPIPIPAIALESLKRGVVGLKLAQDVDMPEPIWAVSR
jgi:hypothetical protein